MSTSIKYLKMYLHMPDRGRTPIGYLSQYGDILRVSFEPAYVADQDRPTLSLTYRGADDAATRAILEAPRDARLVRNDGHWPTYFDNLLPEGHNRDRLAAERKCSPGDDFELLAAAGHDLMGALEVQPVPMDEGIPDPIRHWHTALGLDVLEPGFVEEPVEDGAALPGAVTKFSAAYDGRRYVVKRNGEAGSFILKLPSTRHPDLVANEMAGYRLCGALNLDCAKAEVISREQAELPEHVPFEDILAIRRFDRGPAGQRIHMEEFAQVLGYSPRQKYGKNMVMDYSSMLQVIDVLSAKPVDDVLEFLNRFVAFILLGNTDAHLKNWALIYPDGKQPVLSPIYDPVCVSAFFETVSPADYGVNRRIDATLRAFTWDDFEGLLKAAKLKRIPNRVRQAKNLVKLAKAVWPAQLAYAPPSVQRAVTERLAGGVALAQ